MTGERSWHPEPKRPYRSFAEFFPHYLREHGRPETRALHFAGIGLASLAGINGVWAPIDELKPEEWDQTIETNLRGTYATFRYAVPHLKSAGGGSIVINSSINGTRTFSNSGATAYGCTKAALLALGKMTAVELAKHKIRVNVICPGMIDTEI